ncbi:unnamed protein product [Penicillium salamii]|nr:unnamed protein product [Penicillium salamii]CAG8385087.1 unnamed protein product [Penicillium salamii]
MIRRGPTLIALEEDDIDAGLQRIFFRYSLVVDLDRLHLSEPSKESASPHRDSAEYIVNGSSAVNSDLPGTSLPISSHGPDPPKLNVTYASSQELKSHSGRTIPFHSPKQTEPERLRDPTSHIHKSNADSPQLSFLSCGVSSSPATVPLRDLALASTMSYEAGLAEEAISSNVGSESTSIVILK